MSGVDVLPVMDCAVGDVAFLAEIRKEAGLNVAAGVYALESRELAQARAAVEFAMGRLLHIADSCAEMAANCETGHSAAMWLACEKDARAALARCGVSK